MTNSALVQVNGISKTFGSVRAVQNLSFSVKSGEVFALLGPNGAGKTTVVRMLTGVIQPDVGDISFAPGGQNGGPFGTEDIGYLPEDRGLYQDVSIIRTLSFMGVIRGMHHHDARIAAIDWLDRFDLRDRLDEKLGVLSKGNQQKVQFVASVLHRPRLAILDEPFSGLDPLNQDLFLSIIDKLRTDGTTVLLSAHHMQLVERLADTVLLMDHGQSVLHGSLSEIRGEWGDTSLHDIYVEKVGRPSNTEEAGDTP